jgi:ubiquinone biosynthesis protein
MLALALLAAGLFNALLLGFVARRLLGVPVGWPRTALVSYGVSSVAGSALPGLADAIGLPEGSSASGSTAVAAGPVIALGTAWVFALGLALLVVLEAIVPTGSLPNPLVWLRTLKARRRRARRYTQIVGIAARHGLGGFLRGRSRLTPTESRASVARSLSKALTDGGVTFVKLGQMPATRPDLVGDEAARELGALQTRVTAEPWPVIEAAVARELGTPVPEVFADIDPCPLAAASVAQVHAARLLDGTPVVVKVQRPGARAQATADLDIVLRLAGWLERTTSWGRSLGVLLLAAGFAASLEEELDYTVERANTEAVAASLRGAAADTVGVPDVYAAWSGPRLLVMERPEGSPVAEAEALLAGLPDGRRAQLADVLLAAVLRQVLVDGVFHADLHQGNVFVDETGRLSLLDFGSVGRLDSGGRRSLGAFLPWTGATTWPPQTPSSTCCSVPTVWTTVPSSVSSARSSSGSASARPAAPACSRACSRSSSGTGSRSRHRWRPRSGPSGPWRARWRRSARVTTW